MTYPTLLNCTINNGYVLGVACGILISCLPTWFYGLCFCLLVMHFCLSNSAAVNLSHLNLTLRSLEIPCENIPLKIRKLMKQGRDDYKIHPGDSSLF